MFDLVCSIGLSLAMLVLSAAAAHSCGKRVSWTWLSAGAAVLVLYWAAVVLGAELQGALLAGTGLRWNWLGKLVSVAVILVAIFGFRSLPRSETGLVLRPKDRSIRPALAAMAILCSLSWGAELWMSDGTDLSAERLAFQALMPGLDEELLFRGLLFAIFCRTFFEDADAPMPAMAPALAVTFLFAAGHGVAFADGRLAIDAAALTLTGALGYGLLWIRCRTGCVWPAIVAHNLINFGNSFF